MKALSLWQPWASLVALGVKSIETRSWSTSYRGPLAIHATKCADKNEVGEWCAEKDVDGVPILVRRWPDDPTGRDIAVEVLLLPLGAIVATCTLVDVVPMVGFAGSAPRSGGWLTIGLMRLWLRRPEEPGPGVDVTDQRPYGDFAPGRFAWLLDDITPLAVPIPARGRQGLWNWQEAA